MGESAFAFAPKTTKETRPEGRAGDRADATLRGRQHGPLRRKLSDDGGGIRPSPAVEGGIRPYKSAVSTTGRPVWRSLVSREGAMEPLVLRRFFLRRFCPAASALDLFPTEDSALSKPEEPDRSRVDEGVSSSERLTAVIGSSGWVVSAAGGMVTRVPVPSLGAASASPVAPPPEGASVAASALSAA